MRCGSTGPRTACAQNCHATIYELSADGVEEIGSEQAEPVRLTETLLADRERFLSVRFEA